MKRNIKGVLIFLSALLILSFCSCSSASSSQSAKSTASGSYGAAVAGNGLMDETANGSTKTAPSTSTAIVPAPTVSNSALTRKIIKNADMSLTTADYNKSIGQIESTVKSFGGFVQSSGTQGEGATGSRSATYVVRIPTDKFDSFLDSVGKIGKVVHRNVSGNDVTEQYIDTETRLNTLETEHTRLVDLLKKATDMTDIIKIEDKLTEIETQIEQYEGELKKMDSLVDLSTVNISVSEVTPSQAAASDSFGGSVSNVFTQSISALVVTLKFICYFIIAVLPFAIIIGAVIFIIILIRRRFRKKLRENNEKKIARQDGEQDKPEDKEQDEKKD
jgi:hypothetical protein